MSMEVVRFGELYAIPSGNGLSRPSAVRGDGYRMIGMGELFEKDIISDMEMDRVQMSEREKKSFLVEAGDLLFARQSLVASGAGKCSIVKDLREPTTYESHLIRVRLDKKKCNSWFYYYLFKLPDNPIKAIVNQCAQAGIRGNELVKIKVPFPDRKIQDTVASILSTYDNLIEVNNKRIKILEQMAENLYKEWFVRFRFPGHETAELENGIPKGWEIKKLSSVANITTGKSNRQDADENGQYPFFDRSQEIKRSNIWIKDCEGIIVPGEGTAFIPKYHIGKFDLHQRCYCIEPKQSDIGIFLYYVIYLNRNYFLSVATGATVPSLRLNNFVSMKFIMPRKDLCNRFNRIASDMMRQIESHNKENENLVHQRDLLLPRLMSGKLEV